MVPPTEAPNGLRISRAAPIDRYRLWTDSGFQKRPDLGPRSGVGCIPPSRRAVTPHQMTGRLLSDPVWRDDRSSPSAGWATGPSTYSTSTHLPSNLVSICVRACERSISAEWRGDN